MARSLLGLDETLALLASAPARMAEMATGLTPAQLRAAPEPGEWSAVEVLAHLRSCADVWGAAIDALLAEDHPTVRAIDPRTWMTRTDYPDLEFQPSLDAYAAQRAALLRVMGELSPVEWARTGTFTGAGRPIERTVRSFAHRLAIHERPHLKQMARATDALRVQGSPPTKSNSPT